MKKRSGDGIDIYYDRNIAILIFTAAKVTIKSNVENTQLAFPNGVIPSENMFFTIGLMGSDWYPTNEIAYINIVAGKKNPIIRLKPLTDSITNATLVGTYTYPRNFFDITD